MLNRSLVIAYFLFVVGLCGCLTAGTHGSIKSYQYSLSKYTLEKAVQKIITTSQNIQRDTTKAFNDSTRYDYYNDGIDYLTITITKNEQANTYIIRYAGARESWNNYKISYNFHSILKPIIILFQPQ